MNPYKITTYHAVITASILLSLCLYNLQSNKIKNLEDQISYISNHLLLERNARHEDDGGDNDTYGTYDDQYGIHESSSNSRYLKLNTVVGDGITDDTRAIQKAINKASRNKKDAVILLQKGTFKITETLVLKGGITLRGQGYGSSPLALQFDAGGSVIAYCGEGYAIRVEGHAAALENLAIYDWQYPAGSDCENKKGAGGVLVSADNRLVESVTMKNILIYWFMGGTALTFEAKNSGGIAYASLENIRIRHAKVGLHLSAVDEHSFVNSNSFQNGAISGDITDVGILATGPGSCNDNKINGMVIEPPSTSIAHVFVSGRKTNVIMDRVRLEGTAMSGDQPLVIVEDDSYGNIMNGLLGHTFVQADLNRNPGITFASNKVTGIHPAPNNLFWNAAFHNFDINEQDLPGWSFSGLDFHIDLVPTSQESQLYPDHNIISIVRNSTAPLKLSQVGIPSSHAHSFCTFGIYAKSSMSNSIVAAMKYESGSIIASSSHTGSGKWEFIGMSSKFDQTNGPLPFFSITGDVIVTAPTFSYGYGPATPGAEFLSSSGARMSGVLAMNMIQVSPPSGGGFWTLPREGNIFQISPYAESGSEPCSNSYEYITRINHLTADRFHEGSVITLLFPTCGGCVPCLAIRHSVYVKLLGGQNFAPPPTAVHSSLTIVSGGSGTWSEVSRNTN